MTSEEKRLDALEKKIDYLMDWMRRVEATQTAQQQVIAAIGAK